MPVLGGLVDTLSFGTQVLPMTVTLEARSVQSFGLYVTDANGDAVDITGTVATLEDLDDNVLFTATTNVGASTWTWSLSVSDTTVDWSATNARLVITSSGQRRVWAQGTIRVHP